MAIEQRAGSPLVEVKIFGPYVKRWPQNEAVKKMLDLEEEVYKGIGIKFLPGAEDAIAKDARDGLCVGFFFDHQGQEDGRSAAKAVSKVLPIINSVAPRQYKGAIAPVAVTIGSGDQDPLLGDFFAGIKPKMEKDGLYTVDFTRQKDVDVYGRERPREMLAEYNDTMLDFFNRGFVPAGWPEETLNGGRMNWENRPYGLQPFKKDMMRRMARLVIKSGQEPSFIPVAISGSYKVLKPDGHRPPGLTMARAKLARMTHRVIDLTGIIDVTIGHPIRWNQMIEERKAAGLPVTDTDINDFLGSKLAQMLPVKEKGIHRVHPGGIRAQSVPLAPEKSRLHYYANRDKEAT